MKKAILILTSFSLILIMLAGCRKTSDFSIKDSIFSIPENSDNGTVVGKITPLNDITDTVFTCTILSGNTGDAFTIDSARYLKINNSAALDYETNPSFILSIKAENGSGKNASGKITVNLTNVESPKNGMILYMPFDGDVTDHSDSLNNGISFNSSGYGTGKWGQAMIFDGSNDYVQLSRTLPSEYGLSFSFWMNTSGSVSGQNNGAIISKYSMSGYDRNFTIGSFGSGTANTDNRLWAAFYAYGNSSAYHDMTKSYLEVSELTIFGNTDLWTLTNPTRLTTGTWTHCIVNMSGTYLEIYLNGVLCTKKSREYSTYANSEEETYIGNNIWGGDGSNNHFHGMIDEFKVFNRSLSSDDIKLLYLER